MAQANVAGAAALVTAGAKRVGRVLALRLAKLGFDLALHYCSSEAEAEATASEVKKLGKRCELFKADFHKTGELEGLLPAVIERLPGLAVLVNNASQWRHGKFLDSELQELSEYLRIHLEAPYILTRDFARLVQAGHVVNILDSNIVKNKTDNFAYLLSKKALLDFTLMTATELAPQFKVNAIAPGAVLPPDDTRKKRYAEKFDQNPLERAGSPEDVADALEFLLESKHLSGQVIYTSGGKQLL